MRTRERFDEKWVPEPNSGCWLWMGAVQRSWTPHERGRFSVGERKTEMASRAAWLIYRGAIPAGIHVCHRCDTPLCVNPDHLFLGTQAENNADRDRKGRQHRGEKVLNAKLTVKDIGSIRRRAVAESQRAVAKLYGVSQTSISHIVLRKSWRHVP